MVIIMSAIVRPMMTIVKENTVVRSASVCECSLNALASSPPLDDATMRVTTGRSHTAVILEIAWSCLTILSRCEHVCETFEGIKLT